MRAWPCRVRTSNFSRLLGAFHHVRIPLRAPLHAHTPGTHHHHDHGPLLPLMNHPPPTHRASNPNQPTERASDSRKTKPILVPNRPFTHHPRPHPPRPPLLLLANRGKGRRGRRPTSQPTDTLRAGKTPAHGRGDVLPLSPPGGGDPCPVVLLRWTWREAGCGAGGCWAG